MKYYTGTFLIDLRLISQIQWAEPLYFFLSHDHELLL